jgi:hypothetical protein
MAFALAALALIRCTIALFFAVIITLAALAVTLFVARHLIAVVIACNVAVAVTIVSIPYPTPLSP